MADITQAAATLLAHQLHTHSTTDISVVGSEVDVRTFLSGTVFIYHANIETTANATGVQYIIQGRWPTGSGVNEDWIDLVAFQTNVQSAVASEITGIEAGGETTIAVDADPTAAFTKGRDIYIEDTGTVNAGEWSRVSHSAAGGDIVTLVDGLTNAKDAADTLWTMAERFSAYLNFEGMSWIRMLVLHTAVTGSNIHFKAELVSATDIA